MRLRLIPSAHDSESDADSVLFHERRNDGVQRPLARRERVRLAWLQAESRAPIVQRKARMGRNESRAEARRQALDQRHDVAVAVDGAYVNGVVPLRRSECVEFGWRRVANGAVGPDLLAAPGSELFGDEGLHLYPGKFVTVQVPEQIGVGQLLGFNHHVQR